jgi:hypothetical protein
MRDMVQTLPGFLEELNARLSVAWCRDTSTEPNKWTNENPALGQCAVTALVVQDELGGELVRAIVNGISHYWNRLESGEEVDLTRRQFRDDVRVETEAVPRSREFVLSFPDTVTRYQLLRERLERA